VQPGHGQKCDIVDRRDPESAIPIADTKENITKHPFETQALGQETRRQHGAT